MPSVLEVNEISELAAYQLLWNALLRQTPDPTFFQSFDWLSVNWRHSGGRQRLRVLIVSAGGRPIGILPLVVRTESTRVGPVRVLTYPLDDWGTFFGPVGPNPTATLLAGLGHVRRTRRDWDLLDLRWVDFQGRDRGRTRRAMEAARYRPHGRVWSRGAIVDMSDTWEAYWESRPAKWRQNVGRLRRRLAEHGEVTFVRYRPEGAAYGEAEPRWDLYDACVEVARRSWQAGSTSGNTLCHPSVAAYLRDAHAVAARAGSLDLNLLLVDAQPVAFAYNYHYDGHVYGLRRGFDPQWAASGPGNVLQAMILEDGFRRGDRRYDLGTGSLSCKRPWQTSAVASYRYTHFPRTAPRAQLLRLKRWFQDRFARNDDAAAVKPA
ncbi:MAG: GNAT family N-acetyltransferase [Planctomycetota bacterium]|jgi:CelD/BcsL family acetyltransferase involved in cellulose biosynthesis